MRLKTIVLSFIVFLIHACQSNPKKTNWEKVKSMAKEYEKQFPQIEHVNAKQVMAMHDYVLVDVRNAEEQKISMIEGAISAHDFQQAQDEYKEKTIVLYCTIGYRSSQWSQRLMQKGFRTKNLSGGILEWIHSGGRLVGPDQGPTKNVHTYGPRWNLLPEGYQLKEPL